MTPHVTYEDLRALRERGDEVTVWLVDKFMELESAITWDTTCLNCSRLLDKLYTAEMKLEEMTNDKSD